MRAFPIALSLLFPVACSHQPVARKAPSPDQELERSVKQAVTLRGQFELAGKVGPYIRRRGEAVYLVPHASFTWGSEYEKMQGKNVSVTGTLHFRHFDRTVASESAAEPFDYFYFDAETAKF